MATTQYRSEFHRWCLDFLIKKRKKKKKYVFFTKDGIVSDLNKLAKKQTVTTVKAEVNSSAVMKAVTIVKKP